ncbi:MbtH family NRPS accessory protein [Actinophytocola oryzae]|uniref:MbtH-like protein n=1 Tax=Actinophytocola oryzae TaxID=502181 RepID=A0A4R7VXN4_9PSEU|nr:MbtH family NRPS accessory protein [Actinophytocola oryzae]TDV54239.1 MbtH-like protein [Actinophytocola oryzae]
MNSADPSTYYRVVVNDEGCYCIWPSHLPLPGGWRPTGFSSTAEVALNQVAELWHATAAPSRRWTTGPARKRGRDDR